MAAAAPRPELTVQRVGWRVLAATIIVAGTIAVIGLRWWDSRGNTLPPVSPAVVVLLAVVAAGVALLGLRVRRGVRARTITDPIGAARILVLGQAAALTGAVHVGYFLAVLLLSLPRAEAPDPREQAFAAGVAIVVAGVLIAAGLFTQWCCKVPPEDEDDGPAPG
ncbi:DUF3180 domain-containing protein [Occultella glacieicola]|uniref:DUF3180 domain-containing protein n=1 Tax=Occultella glacieicola TaxID=2518684 RepID=UPI001404B0CE|nr:DUF3180 domain-containing protein [Occultella glacieicola]